MKKITITVTQKEYEIIAYHARKAGMTIEDFVRDVALAECRRILNS